LIAQIILPEAEILSLAVDPCARRAGTARCLVAQLQATPDLEIVHLEVAASNIAARALYASCGFRETERRAQYYRRADGTREDAILLSSAVT
jgi:ribosomal-protein-alanine N-acetyltransferase